ncbi:hypothetical protein M4R22_18355 [Acidovorax sp. GBBC 3334]|uniref:hypothetical protein n=1 Tax=Acidovorax sp. GBBC 3334 TaxID=2940496 RepID=UPI002304667C|nr:hypothetical protein [Acidovorax sp. GBBC 3334]MDA8456727.1 hypothetical protein [Acidovorax sp. GBBC 3334]
MEFTFADPALLADAFRGRLLHWAMVVAGSAAVVGMLDRRGHGPPLFGLPTLAALALCAWGIAAAVSYFGTVARFSALEVRAGTVRVHYGAGPFARSVSMPSDDVQHVLSGQPGKGTYPRGPCYLRLVLRSGETHRSAPTQAATDCKQLRGDIARAVRAP